MRNIKDIIKKIASRKRLLGGISIFIVVLLLILFLLFPKIKGDIAYHYYMSRGYPIGKYQCTLTEYGEGWAWYYVDVSIDGSAKIIGMGHNSIGFWNYDEESKILTINHYDKYKVISKDELLNLNGNDSGVYCGKNYQ